MTLLDELLGASAVLHNHLCPRQVLGVRMGLFAGHTLKLDVPQSRNSKRLISIVETDGCAADGVAVATNCWVGRRTLRIEDYGKVAATFVDSHTKRAVRIVPRRQARQLACFYAPNAANRWEAYLQGYQNMPFEELFSMQQVQLTTPIEKIISQPAKKALCELCGEEINNEREVVREGRVLCRFCAGRQYYRVMNSEKILAQDPGLVFAYQSQSVHKLLV